MEKFIFIKKDFEKLPKTPGVYLMKNKNILYVGKAKNIKKRVKNHFLQPNFRDKLFINQVANIGYIQTDSEIKALLLEAKLIKEYGPKYNIMWRDDKNYFYIAFTKEKIPYLFITHQPEKNKKLEFIGPFVDGNSLKTTLRFLRKVFPYYTSKKHSKEFCSWCHLKLCPGPNPNKKEYRKDLINLKNVLKNKKNNVLSSLKKEMVRASVKNDFEKAGKTRDQLFSLEKVLSNAKAIEKPKSIKTLWNENELILRNLTEAKVKIKRMEAYDISNIQGKSATGSMVVFINGIPNKDFYRKFKIKLIKKPNDIAMLKEVLLRRKNHKEWPLPQLLLIDGGKAQLNVAKKIMSPIKIVALAKKNNELFIDNKKNPILLKICPKEISNLFLHIRDEAHRFAKKYHLKLREIDAFK